MEQSTRWGQGRYEGRAFLGKGGMGAVWRAYDRLTQTQVAVKQVNRDISGEEPRLSLAREFQTLSTLRHPHIISVLDYGFDGGQPYLVMSLLEDSLPITRRHLERHGIKVVDALNQILLALTYLHRRSIVHCDLKPSNVLIGADGVVRLIDFGIASEAQGAIPSALTLRYLAPELIAGTRVTPAADLYSFGVLAYELLTGTHPFEGASAFGLVPQILYEEPDLSMLSVPLAGFVGRLLAKHPEERFANAVEALRALCEASGTEIPVETPPLRESFLQAARLVGRADELEMLRRRIAAMKSGHGGVFVIGGESGVGKSRLLDEIRTIALSDGVRVTRGQAISEGGLAFQIWRDALPSLLLNTSIDPVHAKILRLAVPQIESLTGHVLGPSEPFDSARQFPRALMSLLSEIDAPTLILLEDLQWAREAIPLIQALTPQIERIPILLLCTYRDDELSGLPETLPDAKFLRLGRLSGDALAELAISIIGPEQLERSLLDALLLQTEGNVFFAVEIIRELAENAGSLSAIRHAPDGPVMTGGMKQVLQNRIERAPLWVRPLLDHVAVAGRMLDMPVIRVLSKSVVTLDTWLTVCADAALLDVSPEGAWRFAHDKIREAILADLPHEKRSGLHGAVAEAIEQVHPDNPVYAGTLARHWADAGDAGNASEAALRADAYMRRTSAHKDAQHMLRYVLSRLSDDEYTTYCVPLYLALGERHVELGEFEQARESYEHGLALAERKNIRHGLARGPLGLAYIEWRMGNMHSAFDLFGQVLEMGDTDTLSRIRTLNFMGVYHSNNDAPGMAQRCYSEAEALSIETENREGLLLTKVNQGNFLHQLDNLEAALEASRMACTLAQQEGNGLAEAGALTNVALFLIYLSRLDEAEGVLLEMETLVERLGDRFLAVYAVRNKAVLHQFREEHTAAEVQYLSAIEAFESLGAISEVAHSRYGLIHNACVSGNAANCGMHVRKLIEEARLVGSSELKQLAIYAAALLMALTDHTGLAKRWYAALPSHMQPHPTRNHQLASIIENAIKSETSPSTAPELASSDRLFDEIEAVFHHGLPS